MNALIKKLSSVSRLREADIEHIVRTAPRRYKVYSIAKRSGGSRLIAHPARELKHLQRLLLREEQPQLQVHEAAKAYERGTSIVQNAKCHQKSSWLAKFDITNFFNSITDSDWIKFCRNLHVQEDYIGVSSRLFFWKEGRKNNLCLSVGAPSSPFISNRFMYAFDVRATELAQKNQLIYSRYADDMTFSSAAKIDIKQLERDLSDLLAENGPFKINRNKTRLVRPTERRSVTGVIINHKNELSIGRERKRSIRAMVHNYSKGRSDLSREKIAGNLGYLKMVDLEGYEFLKLKYASSTDLFRPRGKAKSVK